MTDKHNTSSETDEQPQVEGQTYKCGASVEPTGVENESEVEGQSFKAV